MKRIVSATLIVLLLAILLPVQAVGAHGGGVLGTHYVRYGETLFCIARAYGVDPWAIAARNGIVNPNRIYAGMALVIPNAPGYVAPGPVCARQTWGILQPQRPGCGHCLCRYQHLIVRGDTLSGISVRYGVNMWSIASCNGIYNLNYIRAGYWLCIP